jgi:hypothetical protein
MAVTGSATTEGLLVPFSHHALLQTPHKLWTFPPSPGPQILPHSTHISSILWIGEFWPERTSPLISFSAPSPRVAVTGVSYRLTDATPPTSSSSTRLTFLEAKMRTAEHKAPKSSRYGSQMEIFRIPYASAVNTSLFGESERLKSPYLHFIYHCSVSWLLLPQVHVQLLLRRSQCWNQYLLTYWNTGHSSFPLLFPLTSSATISTMD